MKRSLNVLLRVLAIVFAFLCFLAANLYWERQERLAEEAERVLIDRDRAARK